MHAHLWTEATVKHQIRATQLMHRHAAFRNCSSPPHSARLAANMMHYIPAAAAPPAGGVRVGPGGTAMPSTFLMRREDSAELAGSAEAAGDEQVTGSGCGEAAA